MTARIKSETRTFIIPTTYENSPPTAFRNCWRARSELCGRDRAVEIVQS